MPTRTGRPSDLPAEPDGPLDVATLARLANRFFAGGVPDVPASPSAAPPRPPGVPSGFDATPAAPAVPASDERALQAIVHELFGSPAPAPAAPPATPGSRVDAPGSLPSAPAFYFLEDRAPRPDVPALPASPHPPFDVHRVRRDFPILSERVNGRPLVWLDNAATTQKPTAVIERVAHFYRHENSNIHRAAHALAARATDAYEGARQKVARFLGAAGPQEIVFVRGATEGINLVAQTWGRKNLGPGDEILVTWLEHHANIVPWQQVAQQTGAVLKVAPVDDSGQVLLDEFQRLVTPRTKLVAFAQVSNALGTVTPARELAAVARRAGAVVLIDGAQAVSHMRVDVRDLDADFYVLSGHKLFGPTGIGVVYGRKALLDALPPWQGGGNMIEDVTFERATYQGAPARFEAGTGSIADAVGLGAAVDYLDALGMESIARYEHDLLGYATRALAEVPGLRPIGTARDKASVLSFVLAGYEPQEVGSALNEEGIAVRSGHHCAQPILRRFGVEATVRPSLAFYNTCEEIDRLAAVLRRLASARRR